MNRTYSTPLPKWYLKSWDEKRGLVVEFWRAYFAAYPDNGSSTEMNGAREHFKRTGNIPDGFGNPSDMPADNPLFATDPYPADPQWTMAMREAQ